MFGNHLTSFLIVASDVVRITTTLINLVCVVIQNKEKIGNFSKKISSRFCEIFRKKRAK